jgi:hypothetical protein
MISAADGKFVPAQTTIDSDTVVVQSNVKAVVRHRHLDGLVYRARAYQRNVDVVPAGCTEGTVGVERFHSVGPIAPTSAYVNDTVISIIFGTQVYGDFLEP